MSKWWAARLGATQTTVHHHSEDRPTNRHYSAENGSLGTNESSIDMLRTFVVHLFKGRTSQHHGWTQRIELPQKQCCSDFSELICQSRSAVVTLLIVDLRSS
ncbi:hypothetical protein THAOC_09961 [Thalassiosira oceanica]|uniref:Uncharacterized protein n=1 Tax=Thalassiosira oceanica TaxID=159749 RepID=K0STV6_THAOC|nr:hypothetical protein THAOC_09961 [Thalassiosira oceanica]|eukprot:EJK68830.1 hypothetical protein THAOC_09961 [Thalassiosira oceanica]